MRRPWPTGGGVLPPETKLSVSWALVVRNSFPQMCGTESEQEKCTSAAACLLRLWVRIPPGAWMFVYCECCVLSGRGLCDGLITRPEESYQLWCVVVCDLESSWMRRPCPTGGFRAKKKNVSWALRGSNSFPQMCGTESEQKKVGKSCIIHYLVPPGRKEREC